MKSKYDPLLGRVRTVDEERIIEKVTEQIIERHFGGGSGEAGGSGTVSAWGDLTGTLSDQADLQTALDAKVAKNADIAGATKTKVTYDAKGLVTAGADATQDDIGDGTTYKQYSETEKTKLAGIETAADVTDAANVAAAGAVMDTGDETIAGVKTFSSDPLIPDEAYGAGWDGSLEPPTKNSLYDKIETLGSGGQTTVTRIVAASGGDHTTLGAAITAASAQDGILLRKGTYTETTITSALAGLHIKGESRDGSVIDLGTTTMTLSGADVTIENCTIIASTGVAALSGARVTLKDVDIITSGNSQVLSITGIQCRVSNLYYEDGSTNYTTGTKINFASAGGAAVNCVFQNKLQTASLNKGSIGINANRFAMANCTFNYTTSSTNSFHLVLVTSNAVNCSVVNCTFNNDSASFDGSIHCNGNYNNISGCTIREAYYGIYLGDPYNNVNGNTFLSSQNGTMIDVGTNNTSVVGNFIYNSGSTGRGVYLEVGDNNTISGNTIVGCSFGIDIAGNSDFNTIVGNQLGNGNATPIRENASAKANTMKDNTGVSILLEKEFVYMKNTSGATINAGNVVTYKAVAAGDEVTTTTSAGSNEVFGVASAAITNNAYGYIQTLGKTTILTANGTTDIAIGDHLGTFTTAGIVQKAASTHTAIAIALEAYITDDSSGVLDALIIRPKYIA